jgi:hypothetical protein
MKLSMEKIKLFALFAAGALIVSGLQVTPLKASTGEPSGICMGIGHYSSWGWAANQGATRNHSELFRINFDTRQASAVINSVAAGSGGGFTVGEVETTSFTIERGPTVGMYKMRFGDEYMILVPSNAGNTIFVSDPGTGMTGFCQRI